MSGLAAAWRVLGIAATQDRGAIRKAYADRLRAMDPDADPDAYQDLRDARDAAIAWAKQAGEDETPVDTASAEAPSDPIHAEPRPGLPDLPITAPLIEREAPPPAPILAGLLTPPPRLWVPEGERDRQIGEDVALPGHGTFATPVLSRPVDAPPALTILTNEAITSAYDAYRDILLPGGDPSVYALTAEELAAAEAAIDRFMLDPRLDELEFRENASTWIAAIAADAIPRSDALLHRLADRLGWRAQAGTLGEPRAIARVNERIDALDYIATVSTPGHELSRAWRELTTPATERSGRGFVRRSKVEELLTEVRQKHPEVEGWFDGYRVGLWESGVRGPGAYSWIILLIIVAVRLATLAGSNDLPVDTTVDLVPQAPSSGDPALPPPALPVAAPQPAAGLSEPLSDPDRNLTSSLLTLGNGFDVDLAKRQNPGLYRQLVMLWQQTKENDGRLADLDTTVADYFEQRVDRAALVTSIPLATELAKNSLAQVLDVKSRFGADICGSSFDTSKPSPSHSQQLAQGRWRLLVRAVFEVPPAKIPSVPDFHFTIPGDLVTKIGERLDWSPERIHAALSRSGPPADTCRAQIALREIVLAQPSTYPTVLRRL